VLHGSSSRLEAFSSELDPGSRQENASNKNLAGAGLKQAADFPLSRLVWPAILAY